MSLRGDIRDALNESDEEQAESIRLLREYNIKQNYKRIEEMSKLSQITEGYTNLAKQKFGVLSPEIEALGKPRAAICASCPHAVKSTLGGFKCDDCGCQLDAKQICVSCSCPLNKWIK